MSRSIIPFRLYPFAVWCLVAGLALFTCPRGRGDDRAPASAPLIVDSIVCEGNEATPCSFLQSALKVSAGEPLNESELENARVRLALTGRFDEVNIELRRGASRGHVILVIGVKEASPYYSVLRAGGLMATSWSELGTELHLGDRNLFGTGKILQGDFGYVSTLGNPSYGNGWGGLQVIDPHFLGSNRFFVNGGLTYFQDASGNPFYGTNRVFTLMGGVGARIFDFSYVIISYRQEHRSYTFDNYQGEQNAGEVSASYGWSTEDDPYFPRTGSRFVSLLGVSTIGSARIQLGFRKNWALSARFTLQAAIGSLPRGDVLTNPNYYIYTWGALRNQDTALRLSYDVKRDASVGFAHSVRLYLEPGLSPGYESLYGFNLAPGIKAGVALDTQGFGLIDIYFQYLRTPR